MGEWISNIMVLNGRNFSEEIITDKVRALLPKDLFPKEYYPELKSEARVFYSESAKWIIIYDHCFEPDTYFPPEAAPDDALKYAIENGASIDYFPDYQTRADKIAEHFGTTVICNDVNDGSEMAMALSGRHRDLYIGDYILENLEYGKIPCGYTMLFPRDMDISKWEYLLDGDVEQLKEALHEPDVTNRFQKIGKCLGYDDVLWYYDFRNYTNIKEHDPEKLTEYKQIIVESG